MQVTGSAFTLSSQHIFSREERQQTVQQERVIGDHPDHRLTQQRHNHHEAMHRPAHAKADTAPNKHRHHEDTTEQNLDSRLQLLKAMVEVLTGKEIETAQLPTENTDQTETTTATPPSTAESNPDNRQFETIIFSHYELTEYEYSAVNISGSLSFTNAGGEQQLLDINLNFSMERYYHESATELTVRQGRLSDPLVLNLGNSPVDLSAQTTQFDLNGDGSEELIPTLQSNSAYLALDRNGDGQINNGSELFGVSSSNGFAELAQLDQDSNGFIDANDPLFAQLQLYRPEDQYLQSLTSLGIGALYTSAVSSPMRLTDDNNQTLGQVRASSFYVRDDGQTGSIQQIDLAV